MNGESNLAAALREAENDVAVNKVRDAGLKHAASHAADAAVFGNVFDARPIVARLNVLSTRRFDSDGYLTELRAIVASDANIVGISPSQEGGITRFELSLRDGRLLAVVYGPEGASLDMRMPGDTSSAYAVYEDRSAVFQKRVKDAENVAEAFSTINGLQYKRIASLEANLAHYQAELAKIPAPPTRTSITPRPSATPGAPRVRDAR